MILLATCAEIANPKLQEILWCGITLAAGGELIATLLIFVIFLYGMHLAKIQPIPSVMLGLLMVFVFRGVSGGIAAFETIAYIALFAVGTVIALFFWGFSKK